MTPPTPTFSTPTARSTVPRVPPRRSSPPRTLSDTFAAIDDTYACTRVDVEPLEAHSWAFPTLFISADPAGEMMIVYRTVTHWD
ncbi:hypothetical protein C5B85_07175 [Pseudoclavibacter sp. AY1F1]|uniref:hypothetical protein n=1 Tax=Pseudoclavibacter sp. AY1F1 TaxID=2080583 RepID=UPI000CE7F539|nr:hypothetical protein [Pseudoclavibacter sp. AY1F1]PPF45355.1 hypothetical protein C5B85_07175 [Pseudoclavibacter sp. AY1F1]